MQIFVGAPRILVAFLTCLTAIAAFQAARLATFSIGPMLWALLTAALSIDALFGRRMAAMALKYVGYVQGVVTAIAIALPPYTLAHIGWRVTAAGFYLTMAIYLSRSLEVKKFYRSSRNQQDSARSSAQ